MTSNDIQVLAYLYAHPQDHPCQNEAWFQNSINNLMQKQLITFRQLTPKGKTMMNMLCETPLPKQSWTDPRD